MVLRFVLAVGIVLAGGAALAAPPPPAAAPPVAPPPAAPAAAAKPDKAGEAPAAANTGGQVDLKDIRTFTSVYNLVKQAYVDKVDDHRLMQAAIRGLLAGLDPHSEYLDKVQLESLNEDTSGSYDGLGVEILQSDGALRVVAPIDDSPAQRAGIRPGDTIVSINGKLVQSDDLDGAIASLRGKVGTEITLGILHTNAQLPVTVKLKREVIRVASVRGRLLEPGYAYLRISQFQSETGGDLDKRIERLEKQNKGPLHGAILDLRSNPGGLLTSAVEVADDLLDSGVIVTTRGRLSESDLSFRATPGDALDGAPLVVLVDNGTASAAEIVAGALKDNHRALLMGQRTFGKGSVQTVLPLDADHAVKLTTARYYTPDGTSIQAEGIRPDIVLPDLTLAAPDGPPTPRIAERDLPNHLTGPGDGSAAPATQPFDDTAVRQDYALNEALTVVKALALRHPARQAPAARNG